MENTKALEVAGITDMDAFVRAWSQANHGGQMTEVCKYAMQLRAQLAERDAQLAAERAMADDLAEALKQSHEFIVDCTIGDWDYEANGTDWPDSLVTRNNEELVAYKATRQPTQDKGG